MPDILSDEMDSPPIGRRYRGIEGRSGYLLRLASHEFRGAMEMAVQIHGLTAAQYAALSVLELDPGMSGADLARACKITPQAMNGVLATLERDGLVERRPHPTHGRILQVLLTDEGKRHLDAAHPAVRELEATIEDGFTQDQIATVKAWLASAAQRLEQIDSR